MPFVVASDDRNTVPIFDSGLWLRSNRTHRSQAGNAWIVARPAFGVASGVEVRRMTQRTLSFWQYLGYTALFLASLAVAFCVALYQIIRWLH